MTRSEIDRAYRLALDNTLQAISPHSEAYSAVFGEDWAEFTERERQAVIDDDYRVIEEELDREDVEQKRLEEEAFRYAAYDDLWQAAIDVIHSLGYKKAREKHFDEVWTYEWLVHPSLGGSSYIWLFAPTGEFEGSEENSRPLKIRFSDHAPIPGGGWNDARQERHGDPDFSVHLGGPGSDDLRAFLVSQ